MTVTRMPPDEVYRPLSSTTPGFVVSLPGANETYPSNQTTMFERHVLERHTITSLLHALSHYPLYNLFNTLISGENVCP